MSTFKLPGSRTGQAAANADSDSAEPAAMPVSAAAALERRVGERDEFSSRLEAVLP